MFIRILFATTGIVKCVSGLFLLIASAISLYNKYQFPRPIVLTFVMMFISGYLMNGMCWLVLAINNKFWK